MSSLALALVLLPLCGAASPLLPAGAMPVRLAGPWTIEIGPGEVTVEGRVHALGGAVQLEVEPPETLRVENERHARLPVFNPNTGGWRRGAALAELVTQETTAAGRLLPDSVRVRPVTGGDLWKDGADYRLDPEWATLGRVEAGGIGADTPVALSYSYQPDRIDLVALKPDGTVALVRGPAGVGLVPMPEIPEGSVPLATVWVPGLLGLPDRPAQLEAELLFPVAHPAGNPAEDDAASHGALPKTLAKLRAGEPVTIVAWGDSVTNGGGVEDREDWYQHQFLRRLRARFPDAEITLLTAAWGGASSRQYLEAPPGGEHDFQRDVLDPAPDLVTIEFVNDAYLDEAGVARHYAPVVERIQATGAEVLFFTPHLVRQDWMGLAPAAKVTEDPRKYTAGLRAYTRENGLALADAAYVWASLWKQGLPYLTLLANSINHPDERGHRIFADVLLRFFPPSER